MLLSGLDRVTAERMILLGLSSYAEIAAWSEADVARWRERLGLENRIAANGWIEQASLLARGIETAYAARVRRGELNILVKRPMPEPPRIPGAVRRPAPPRRRPDQDPLPPPPQSLATAATTPKTGSLMRRLSRIVPAKSLQIPRRAAISGPIEEATVEIVHRAPPPRTKR